MSDQEVLFLDPGTGARVHASINRDGTVAVHEGGFVQTLTQFMSNAKEHTYVITPESTLAELEAAREVEAQKREKARTKAVRHSDRIKVLDDLIKKAKLPKEPANGGTVRIVRLRRNLVFASRLASGNWALHELGRRLSWDELMGWASSYGSFTVERVVAFEAIA
ncbi:hypothetical protein E3_1760 [Rhodococcus phage E3]|uniref:hypothetical protein n=1 Tax=Rhodococcus phage E3 TaxID=1007869 RepID=UPI0002C6C46B|nr:hypothetical protein M176_gp186 [Rhodococcus phage E3]AEQ21094.1 hypothetical protein E3_1760 [Rhodococcus phage E3]